MRVGFTIVWALVAMCGSARAQAPVASDAEKQELAEAVQEASTSGFDIIRALETHLRKYPATPLRPEIFGLLAKAAVDTKDDARIILYGEPVLLVTPNDVTLLDRVTRALLSSGGKQQAARALDYAKRFEDYVIRVPVPAGYDPVKNQEDHDRVLARALLYQARARNLLGEYNEARRKAALAYIAYPDEPSAREWSDALEHQGKHAEAIQRLADAFAISDPRATDEDRAVDRKKLGEMYRALHGGSETGLGDEILAAYDRTAETMDKRRSQLRALDPNLGLTEAGRFTLGALGGGKLNLATLRGKVLILDFWATWCVPCRAQHPLYDEVKKRFRDRNDVVFLAVNTDEDHELIAPFMEAQHWTGDVYFDSGLVRLLAVNSIPTTVIVDQAGRIVSRMNGFNGGAFVDQLTARIEAALATPGGAAAATSQPRDAAPAAPQLGGAVATAPQ
jgi:thiol-disulfide isomerase/thioredoxin